jgi:hypothetical protein
MKLYFEIICSNVCIVCNVLVIQTNYKVKINKLGSGGIFLIFNMRGALNNSIYNQGLIL